MTGAAFSTIVYESGASTMLRSARSVAVSVSVAAPGVAVAGAVSVTAFAGVADAGWAK